MLLYFLFSIVKSVQNYPLTKLCTVFILIVFILMNNITLKDIDPSVSSQIYRQNYAKKRMIEDVKIIALNHHVGEDGDFSELMRLHDGGYISQLPDFKIRQINRSRVQQDSIKAWHLHLKQNDLWYTSPFNCLLVGLWDVRKSSQTSSQTMRVVLGGGASHILFIPKGVAHGYYNISQNPIDIFYFVDHYFNPQDPDEYRIKWDALGADFWTPQKD